MLAHRRSFSAVMLLTIVLGSCRDATAPPVPDLQPDLAAFTKLHRDDKGNRHTIRHDFSNRRTVKWDHDVEGREFARLRFHISKSGEVERVTGTLRFGDQRVDVARVQEELKAQGLAVDSEALNRMLQRHGNVRLAQDLSRCIYEIGIWAISTAALVTGAFSGVGWSEVLVLSAWYLEMAERFLQCYIWWHGAAPG